MTACPLTAQHAAWPLPHWPSPHPNPISSLSATSAERRSTPSHLKRVIQRGDCREAAVLLPLLHLDFVDRAHCQGWISVVAKDWALEGRVF